MEYINRAYYKEEIWTSLVNKIFNNTNLRSFKIKF